MKFWGYQRFLFTGEMYVPTTDTQSEDAAMTYIKDIKFDFMSSPATPRQVIIADEPFPTSARIVAVVDRYGMPPMIGAEWTITSVEPVFNPFRGTDMYQHLAALYKASDFGYPVAR